MKVKVKLRSYRLFGWFGKTITIDIDDSWKDSCVTVQKVIVEQKLKMLFDDIDWSYEL